MRPFIEAGDGPVSTNARRTILEAPRAGTDSNQTEMRLMRRFRQLGH